MLQKLNPNLRKTIVTLKRGVGVGRKTVTSHKLLKNNNSYVHEALLTIARLSLGIIASNVVPYALPVPQVLGKMQTAFLIISRFLVKQLVNKTLYHSGTKNRIAMRLERRTQDNKPKHNQKTNYNVIQKCPTFTKSGAPQRFCSRRTLRNSYLLLNNFKSMFLFYNPENISKPEDF